MGLSRYPSSKEAECFFDRVYVMVAWLERGSKIGVRNYEYCPHTPRKTKRRLWSLNKQIRGGFIKKRCEKIKIHICISRIGLVVPDEDVR